MRDPKLPTRVHSYYAIKFARFNANVRRDRKLAEKILLDAMLRDKTNPMIHTQLVAVSLCSFAIPLGTQQSITRQANFTARKASEIISQMGS